MVNGPSRIKTMDKHYTERKDSLVRLERSSASRLLTRCPTQPADLAVDRADQDSIAS